MNVKSIDRVEELKRLNTLKLNIVKTKELNSSLRHMTNDEKLKNSLHNMNNIFKNKLLDIQKEFDRLG